MSLGSPQPSPPDPSATLSAAAAVCGGLFPLTQDGAPPLPGCPPAPGQGTSTSRVPSSPWAGHRHFPGALQPLGPRPSLQCGVNPAQALTLSFQLPFHPLTDLSITQTRHRPDSRAPAETSSSTAPPGPCVPPRPAAASSSGFAAAQTKDLGVAKTPHFLTSRMPRILFSTEAYSSSTMLHVSCVQHNDLNF